MHRSARRWQSTLGQWVATYTVSRLANDLSARGAPTTQKAIYHWLAGRCSPRPTNAAAIVQLSGGQLSLGDVYAHREQIQSHAHGARAPG